MREIENHHHTITTVIIASSKIYQWMLKFMDET